MRHFHHLVEHILRIASIVAFGAIIGGCRPSQSVAVVDGAPYRPPMADGEHARGVGELQEMFPWRGDWRVRVETSPRESAGIEAEEAIEAGIKDHHFYTAVFRTTKDGVQEVTFRPVRLPDLDTVDEIAWHGRESFVLGTRGGEPALIENIGRGWRKADLPEGWKGGERSRLLAAPGLLCLWHGGDFFIRRDYSGWEQAASALPDAGEDGRSKGIFHAGFLYIGIRNGGAGGLFRAPAALPPGASFEHLATGNFSGIAPLKDGRLLVGFDSAPSAQQESVTGLFTVDTDGKLTAFNPGNPAGFDPASPVLSVVPAAREGALVAIEGAGVFRVGSSPPRQLLIAFDEPEGTNVRPVLLGENTLGEVVIASPRYGLLSPPKKTLEVRATIEEPFLPIERDIIGDLEKLTATEFFSARLAAIDLPGNFLIDGLPAREAAKQISEILAGPPSRSPLHLEIPPELLDSAPPFTFRAKGKTSNAKSLVEAFAASLNARTDYVPEGSRILLLPQNN